MKHLNYTYQGGEGGIAEALGLAEHFADGHPICVVLGDNIIENNIWSAVEKFRKQEQGAKILLKEVSDAHRFGVALNKSPTRRTNPDVVFRNSLAIAFARLAIPYLLSWFPSSFEFPFVSHTLLFSCGE